MRTADAKTARPGRGKSKGAKRRIDELEVRLAEAEETIAAIRSGLVDALVVETPRGERIYTLRGAERAYRVFLETMAEGAVTATAEGLILHANRRFAEITGKPLERVIGESLYSLVRPDDRETLEALLQPGVPGATRGEVGMLRDAGGEEAVPALLSANPLPESDPPALCLVVSDLSELKKREAQLVSLNEELSRSNADLQQFAYAASHDLQEPLRTVSSFTQLLERRYKEKLDSKAEEFIGFIVEGSRRMQILIDDLLAYSRVGTKGEGFQPVPMEEVLTESLANLQAALEETGAQVDRDPLPVVSGDRLQLVQLFQNLLSNALKFHKPGEPPRLRISARRSGSEWSFSVADNGIGIDPGQLDRIFVIFQRLHGRQEYPGTGIGLALCKRIVERHGGRIWVESEKGKGSVFFFALPT
jgi:PAS domain S-box-containing protein